MTTRTILIAACAALLAPASLPRAAEDPEALLRRVAESTRAARALSADYTRDLKSKMVGHRRWEGRVRVMKPNYARLDIAQKWDDPVAGGEKRIGPETYASTGDIAYALRGSVYTQEAVDPAGQKLQMWRAMPLQEFFSSAGGRLERIRRSRADGTLRELKALPDEVVDGVPCRVIAWSFADASNLWKTFRESDPTVPAQVVTTEKYYIGPDHLIRRIVISSEAGNKSLVNDYALRNLRKEPSLTAADFAYTPPATATLPAERPPLLPAGTPAPDFRALAHGGGEVSLASLRGKVVVLDFWATWCGPCIRTMPHLEKIHQAVKGQDVVVLALCVWDDKPKYDAWVPANRSRFSYSFAFDPAGRDSSRSIATRLYRVSGIPTCYVIDREGKIAEGLITSYPDSPAKLNAALRRLGVRVADEGQ